MYQPDELNDFSCVCLGPPEYDRGSIFREISTDNSLFPLKINGRVFNQLIRMDYYWEDGEFQGVPQHSRLTVEEQRCLLAHLEKYFDPFNWEGKPIGNV